MDNMVKLGPLVRSDYCASMRDGEDRFTTHLIMMLCGEDVPGLFNVVANVDVAVVVVVDFDVFVWLLGFEQP